MASLEFHPIALNHVANVSLVAVFLLSPPHLISNILLPMKSSSTTDTSKLPSGAATSTGLDLLFAATQLTSSRGSHHRTSVPVPVNHGQYLYPPPPQRGVVDAISNHADPARSSDGGDAYSQVVEPSYTKSFVQLLMDILNDRRNASIICWVPDGQSFLIADQKRFEQEILPTVFRGSLFNSFVRKLNRWGFRRLKRTGHSSSFAHDMFIRDKPWLCANMRCISKPSFKKVPHDVRQSAFDAGASVTISHSDNMKHDGPTSNSSHYSNMNVSQPLSSPSLDVSNIPPSAAENDVEESMKRELLYASIAQSQFQMDHQMQYLNNLSALADEELIQ
eukprot:scaffold29574_cov223-Skeletonema_menzelii.AAC.1